jgi:hypothetical protein
MNAHGCPPLRQYGFIKSTPLEGRAVPSPWWCLLIVCVVVDGLVYLEADVRRNERKMGGFASLEIFGTCFEIWFFLRWERTGFESLDFSTVSRNF